MLTRKTNISDKLYFYWLYIGVQKDAKKVKDSETQYHASGKTMAVIKIRELYLLNAYL